MPCGPAAYWRAGLCLEHCKDNRKKAHSDHEGTASWPLMFLPLAVCRWPRSVGVDVPEMHSGL